MSSLSPVGLQLARTTHIFAFAGLFGASLWQYVTGPVALKTLDRQTFGRFQAGVTPSFFLLSSVASVSLLLSLAHLHPHPTPVPTDLKNVNTTWNDVKYFLNPTSIWNTLTSSSDKNVGRQGLILAAASIASLVNLFSVGPATTAVMYERHDLEKRTGEDPESENPSEEMKKLNVSFNGLHSISTIMSTSIFGGLVLHGIWLSRYGFGGK